MGGEPLKLEDLRVGRAIMVLKDGFTVRGIVIDPAGKPMPGVLIKEGYGLECKSSGEFRTDKNGRFERVNRPRRQLIFTSYPTNHAITTALVDVESSTPEVRLQVQPVNPLRLKVVDEQGAPVAGASVSVAHYATEGQMLEFQGVTTAEGTLTWTNAPTTAVELQIDAPSLLLDRLLRIPANQREVTCRLRRGENEEVLVRGQVRDAETGQPVRLTWVAITLALQEAVTHHEARGQSDFVLPIQAAKFRAGIYPSYQLELRAEGYENLVSEGRDFTEGDWDAVFLMRKGGRRSGQIVLQNNKPAAGADVFALEKQTGPLRISKPGRVYQTKDKIHEIAGLDGRFAIEHTGWDSPIIITHEQGFLSTSLYQLTNGAQLTLQPWGRVEGILRVGAASQKDTKVVLTGGKEGNNGWSFHYESTTDTEGRFSFEKVPPGEHLMFHGMEQGLNPIPVSHTMRVMVKAGEIAKVNFGGTGCPVIGRVAGNVDWSRATQSLVGFIAPANLTPAPQGDDFATRTAFEKAQHSYSDLIKTRPTRHGQFLHDQLSFDKDGSFRIDNLPPGTYELHLQVILNVLNSYTRRQELAWLDREVVVPAMPGGRSDTPLDLGQLTLHWADPTHPAQQTK